MREMTPADLAALRDAVQFRDRCVAAAVKHYRWVGIAPSDQHARAAFDAIEPLIATRVRAQVAEERQGLIDALADCVVKATEYGSQDGDFVANYILPTGPIHRAIPLLDGIGVTVRPGFDGRSGVLRLRNPFDSPLVRWALTISRFREESDEAIFAAVATEDGGVAKLTYGDARAILQDLLDAQNRLGRIASWHSLETGPGGMVGVYCKECRLSHPCETRRMADGTHEDLADQRHGGALGHEEVAGG